MAALFKLDSFGEIQAREWAEMSRPFIPVFYLGADFEEYQDEGLRFSAKLYDGERYTGYHIASRTLIDIIQDIEKTYPEFKRFTPGSADPKQILCIFA